MTSTSRILPRGCKAMQRDWLVCNLVHCREDNLQTVSFAGPGSNTFAFVWYAATYPEVLDFGTLPGVDRIGPRATWDTEGQVLQLFLICCRSCCLEFSLYLWTRPLTRRSCPCLYGTSTGLPLFAYAAGGFPTSSKHSCPGVLVR